jgi:hypothetical protein
MVVFFLKNRINNKNPVMKIENYLGNEKLPEQ